MSALLLFAAFVMVVTPFALASRFSIARSVSPLHILAASLFLGVGLKTIAWIVDPERTVFYRYASRPDDILLGYGYVLLFVLCLCAGYLLSSGRGHPRAQQDLAQQTQLVLSDRTIVFLTTLTTLIAVGVAWLYLGQRSAEVGLPDAFTLEGLTRLNVTKLDRLSDASFGAAYSYITVFFAVIPITFALLLSQFYVRKTSLTLVAATAFAVLLWIGSALLRGKRGDLLEILALLVVIHFCFRRRISFKTLAIGAAGALGVLALFSLMTTMRMTKDNLGIDGAAAFDSSINQIFYSTYFFDINISSLIVTEMDTSALKNGQTYFDWVIGLVPRALWPDKPAISLGLYVKSVILHQPGTIGGVNPTMAGEAFINFGWYGAAFGLVWGMLFRWVERTLLSARMLACTGGPWLYAWIIFSMIWSLAQTSFSIYLTGLLVELAIATVVIAFMRWAFPRAWPRATPARAIGVHA